MDEKFKAELVKASAADLMENPSVLFAVSNLANKGDRNAIDDLIALDIKRGFQNKGPVYFPHIRGAVNRYLQRMKLKTQYGMGQAPYPTGAGGKITTPTPSAGTQIATAIIGAVATIGATYYANQLQIDAQKDQYKLQQRLEAQRAEQEAAQIEAMLALERARAARVTTAPREAGMIPGLPSWAPLVGIGAAVLFGVFYFMKK